MKMISLALLLAALTMAQQEKPARKDPAAEAAGEQFALQQALSEANGGPLEFIGALEAHLKKYPESPRRRELERAMFKAALDSKDEARVVRYGESVLVEDEGNLQALDRVSRGLLAEGSRDKAEKALVLAKRLEERLKTNDNDSDAQSKLIKSARERARFRDEMDKSMGRALLTQAKAHGVLGHADLAADAARRSFAVFPSAEAGRELATWLLAAGKAEEALAPLADAFTITEPKMMPITERMADRKKLGEVYTKLKGSETGLGDLILASYDRTSALLVKRRETLKEIDPNLELSDPLQYTLSGVKGDRLALSSLKGKVVVLDFWATWCGPCRAQYPLYEEVKKRFKDRGDVVFLAVNTDDDRGLVEPFLKEQKWNKNVYFEDGLANLLRVSSIPTTVVFGREGGVAARMNGYLPERFVEMLSARIDAALQGIAP